MCNSFMALMQVNLSGQPVPQELEDFVGFTAHMALLMATSNCR